MVVIVFFSLEKQFDHILIAPEWAFASTILFGMAIIKLTSGTSVRRNIHWQRVQLIVSLTILFGILPSLVVLILNLKERPSPSIGIVVSQIVLFLVGTIIFFILGKLGHTLLGDKD